MAACDGARSSGLRRGQLASRAVVASQWQEERSIERCRPSNKRTLSNEQRSKSTGFFSFFFFLFSLNFFIIDILSGFISPLRWDSSIWAIFRSCWTDPYLVFCQTTNRIKIIRSGPSNVV